MTHAEILYAFFVSLPVTELSIGQLSALSEPFGITVSNIRCVLSRFTGKTMIAVRKEGRTAYYRMDARGRRIGSNTMYHFREPDWADWDERYWGAAFSESDEGRRYRLRKKLTAYRFRALYPGFWIRPLNPHEKIPEVFRDLVSGQGFDLFSCSFHGTLTRDRIRELFELDSIEGILSNALAAVEKSVASAALMPPAEAFRERVLTGNAIVHALVSDPLLPPSLLPESWPARRLREGFGIWNRYLFERSEPFIRKALGNTQ